MEIRSHGPDQDEGRRSISPTLTSIRRVLRREPAISPDVSARHQDRFHMGRNKAHRNVVAWANANP